MFHIQSCPKQKCRLMAVLCGNYVNAQREERRDKRKYAFPELISSGGLEVGALLVCLATFNFFDLWEIGSVVEGLSCLKCRSVN